MKFDQLTYFIETARLEHIGKAAKTLNISPSAISHSIAQLEEELGRELFSKKGKRIALTLHGRLLMERSKKLLEEFEKVREELKAENVPLKGNHKLAASHDLCVRFLSKSWIRLHKENPGMTGELFTVRSAQVIAGVLSGEYDFGLCFNPVEHPDLKSAILRTGKILVAVRKDHPVLKLKESEKFKALSQFPAALPKSFQGIDVCERHPMFEKYEIKVRPQFLFDSYGIGLSLVAESDCWSFIPEWLIEEKGDEVEALKPPSGWAAPYHIAAVWAKDHTSMTAIQKLVAILKTVI